MLDQIVGPARRQHVGLLDEIEIRIVAPRGIGEALVAGVGRGDRRRLLALETLQGRRPEFDELLGQRGLRRERPLRIGQVIIDDPADGARHLADLIGDRGLDLTALPRSHVGGQRLAALLDRLRDVMGERLHVEGRLLGACARRLRGARRRRRSAPCGFWRRGGRRRVEARSGLRLAFAAQPAAVREPVALFSKAGPNRAIEERQRP